MAAVVSRASAQLPWQHDMPPSTCQNLVFDFEVCPQRSARLASFAARDREQCQSPPDAFRALE